jgi:trehalose synthase
VTGYTVNSVEGAAFRVRQLLGDPALRDAIGRDAREFVRHNFLITRNLGDLLAMMALLLRS